MNTDMLRKLQSWAYDDSMFAQLECPTIQEALSAVVFGLAFRSVVLPAKGKMDAKDSFVFFILLLLSLWLFGSLGLTYCVWNKHADRSS